MKKNREGTNLLSREKIKELRTMIDGQEKERQRLSRELHDGIGQSLVALKLRLENMLYIDQAKIDDNIRELIDLVDNTIDEIRRISDDLMPSVLTLFGIAIALRNLCKETEKHTGIVFFFETRGDLDNMHSNIKTYIFRIVQEAINNIVKHSEAKKVLLHLSRDEDELTLLISDNGKGFYPDGAKMENGNGLHNMRERVNLLNGFIEINSVIDKGTTIKVKIPVF